MKFIIEVREQQRYMEIQDNLRNSEKIYKTDSANDGDQIKSK